TINRFTSSSSTANITGCFFSSIPSTSWWGVFFVGIRPNPAGRCPAPAKGHSPARPGTYIVSFTFFIYFIKVFSFSFFFASFFFLFLFYKKEREKRKKIF
ncbi:MAG: hypothetical protein IKN43_02020, partial [Selenomonadaceae bacterium]|nr:hypothetical protein [Selenomonadaceae bacterium]